MQVDILYFHAPETTVPFEEQLEAANELYKQGAFRRLGLSNFTAEQVEEVYNISKKNGYPLPAVYQGNYSAVGRLSETVVLPTLRKYGISYYAYSPIAGGFLAKTRKQIEEGAGRFDPNTPIGQLYVGLYSKPSYLAALDAWEKIAEDAGIPKAELAYRWAAYHSFLNGDKGDGIIFGAHKLSQIEQTIASIRAGSLPKDIVERVNAIWDTIKHEAPLDNFNK
jgi:aflatoxin B1 aldehyde reductase